MPTRAHDPRAGLFAGVALLVPLAYALAISLVVTPEDIESGRAWVAPACSIRTVLGHPCPTCGMSRAFAALGHGRLDDALRYNKASPYFYAAYWAGALSALIVAARSYKRYRMSPRGAANPMEAIRS